MSMYGILLARLDWCLLGTTIVYLELLEKLIKTNMQDYWSFSCWFYWTLGLWSKCSELKSFLLVLSELAQLVPLPFSHGSSTRYSDRLHDFSVTIPRCYKDVYVNCFFPRTARLQNALSIEFFPLTYDLSGFKSRIYRNLLTVGSL